MRKLLIAILALSTLIACEKENITPDEQHIQETTEYTELDNSESESRGFLTLVNVCLPGKFGLPAVELRLTKFSAKLKQKYFGAAVDLDGDGYYDKENECSDLPVDCDDSDPAITEECYCYQEGEQIAIVAEHFTCEGDILIEDSGFPAFNPQVFTLTYSNGQIEAVGAFCNAAELDVLLMNISEDKESRCAETTNIFQLYFKYRRVN